MLRKCVIDIYLAIYILWSCMKYCLKQIKKCRVSRPAKETVCRDDLYPRVIGEFLETGALQPL